MAKSARNRGENRPGKSPGNMDDLEDFEHRLRQARDKQADEGGDGPARSTALGAAFRISTELIAGIAVGGFIGWQLDWWLETQPLFLLVFFMLGAAAGLLNVIRTAWSMQAGDAGSGDGSDKPGR